MVTPKEFRDKMEALAEESTPEEFHITADEYMCEVLTELGYGEGVAIFDGTERWYS